MGRLTAAILSAAAALSLTAPAYAAENVPLPVEAGDLLTFPQGFRCQWIILEPIRVKGKL